MNLDGSKILVTGGCGLVGSTTIDLLLRDHRPERIVILDNLSRGTLENVAEALKDPRVTLVRGDIRDVGTVREVTAGMDAVIHMATLRITACAAEPREALEVMCDGSFNVVRLGLGFLEEFAPYHFLLTVSWSGFFATVVVSYVLINVVFAAAFLACGADALAGAAASTFGGPLARAPARSRSPRP